MRIGIDARKVADFGIGTYIRGLLGGLVRLRTGDEIVALAPRDTPLPDGVEHVAFDAPHYSIRELFAVGAAARRAGVDLLHSPHYVTPVTSLPLVVTIHDLIHLHQPQRSALARPYARFMIQRALRRARRVLTVTSAVRAELVAEMGADAGRIVVTPNGVRPATRSGHSGAPPPYFLFVGNDKPHKNAGALLTAFARVRATMPDARLVLAGANFERYAGIAGVECRGFVAESELDALYAGAVALVLPSREEGFGLPAAEAMAAGTAVVTSTCAALVEVTGDAALHADAEDPDALAAAMLRLARDTGLRAALASRGRERAASLTWERCAVLTRDAYDAALRGE